MKGKTAFNAMEGIDPRYILEAAPDVVAPVVVGRRTKFLRLAAVAAALAVVVAVGAVVAPMLMKEDTPPLTEPPLRLNGMIEVSADVLADGSNDEVMNVRNQQSFLENPPVHESFTVNGQAYPLTYEYSVYYTVDDIMGHLYRVVGIEGFGENDEQFPYVMYTDDGELLRTGYFYLGQIDMAQATDDSALARLLEEALAVYGVSFDGYETVDVQKVIHTAVIWSNQIGELKDPRFTRAVIDPEGRITVLMDLPRVELTITEDDIPTDAAIVAMAEEMANKSAHAEHGPVDALYVEEKRLLYRNGQFWIDAYVFVNKTTVDALTGKSYYAGTVIRYFVPVEEQLFGSNEK